MTTALPSVTLLPSPAAAPAAAPRLRVAPPHQDPAGPREPAVPPGEEAPRFAAYLVVLPADMDPGALFAGAGLRPPIHAVAFDDRAFAPAVPAPAQGAPPQRGAVLADGTLVVDTARRVAEVDGVDAGLTYLEFSLLARLMERPGQVHSREQLVHHVWGYEYVGDGRTVDVHVARIRRKLGAAYRGSIVTVRRVGYKYVSQG